MPKKEINDYVFYKIICLDDNIELCYVGSTANWKARNHQHKISCNNETNKSYNQKIYKTIRENGGWDNFKMVQLGTREQLTKRQAEQIEEEYRQELKANLNSHRCYLTQEQRQELHKELCKNYYEANKEQKQKYYKENIDKIREQQHNYYEANKEQKQKYYKENKDKIIEKALEKVNCECGCTINKSTLSIHRKSKKHIKLMELKTENEN